MTKKTPLRLAILGRDNPLSRDPRFALYPIPHGSTGHRLYQMFAAGRVAEGRLGRPPIALPDAPRFSISDYISIERRNLCDGKWDRQRAERDAPEVLARWLGWDVVVLGRDVWGAIGLPHAEPLTSHLFDPDPLGLSPKSIVLHYLPHPSGRNLWFSNKGNMAAAQRYLGRLFDFAWDERERSEQYGSAR